MKVIIKRFHQEVKVIEIEGRMEELKGFEISHNYSEDILILDNGLENSNNRMFVGNDKEGYLIGLTETQIEEILKEDRLNQSIINMEEKLKAKLDYLYIMQEKYNKLNHKTKYAYRWRYNAITEQIDALEGLRDDKSNDDWNECYEEDLRDSNYN